MPNLNWLKEEILQPKNADLAMKLKMLADKTGLSMTHLAIGFCAINPNVSSVILGASRLEQLKDNLETIKFMAQIHRLKSELENL